MRWGNVTFIAAIFGLVWGAVWMVLTSLLTMLVSGVVMVPAIGAAALAGALIGGVHILIPPAKRQLRSHIFTGIIAAILLLVLSGFKPFGISVDTHLLPQIGALIIWSGLVIASMVLCCRDYDAGSAKRYRIEALIIRFLKGMGLLLFTVLVALPFYVMVMTSLKSQQSLLKNPLDFSVDLSAGLHTLFRSYIELFTDYHFATFLISNVVTNNAAAALLFPIALDAADQTGVDKIIMSYCLMLGASASFMSPFGYT